MWRETVVYLEVGVHREIGVARVMAVNQEPGVLHMQSAGYRLYPREVDAHRDVVFITETRVCEKRKQKVKFEDDQVSKPEAYELHKLPVFIVDVEDTSDDEDDDEEEVVVPQNAAKG
jgi:hypothetical protein